MRKFSYIPLFVLPLLLTGCNGIGDKSTSMSIIYLATMVLSFLLLIGYFILIRKKTVWFGFLFSSVFVVNTGYYLLSVSKTLDTALFANRLSYLGSAFLPMSIIMIVLNVTSIKYKKWLPWLLSTISVVVFLISASYPYLTIYYADVVPKEVNGVMVLCKTYGSWHSIYLVFLLAHFLLLIGIILHTFKSKKLNTKSQAIFLAIATFVNICVWLLEQLVDIDFEFLSVSYIISELFLMGLFLAIEDTNKAEEAPVIETEPVTSQEEEPIDSERERIDFFKNSISKLTPTETKIYNYYTEGKSTKEIMALLNIKENTLKYHNKNIYSKLGVSSRKELLYFSKMI